MNDQDLEERLARFLRAAPEPAEPVTLLPAVRADRERIDATGRPGLTLQPLRPARLAWRTPHLARPGIRGALVGVAACLVLAFGLALSLVHRNEPMASPAATFAGTVEGIDWRVTAHLPLNSDGVHQTVQVLPGGSSAAPGGPAMAVLGDRVFVFAEGAWASRDGATWTNVADDAAFGPLPGIDVAPEGTTPAREWVGAAADDRGNLFAVDAYTTGHPGATDDARIWMTRDASHWTETTLTTFHATTVASRGGTVVVAGITSAAPLEATAWFWDGDLWRRASIENATLNRITQVVATPDGFVAIGTSASGQLTVPAGDATTKAISWESSDGQTWRRGPDLPFAPTARVVAFGNRLLTYNTGTAAILSSVDHGRTWQTTVLDATSTDWPTVMGMVQVGSSLVAIGTGSGPQAWASSDGLTWKAVATPTNLWRASNVCSLIAFGDRLVVVGGFGTVSSVYVGTAKHEPSVAQAGVANVVFNEGTGLAGPGQGIPDIPQITNANGAFYVAVNMTVGDAEAPNPRVEPRLWASADGQAWTLIADPAALGVGASGGARVMSVTEDGHGGLVAVGANNSGTGNVPNWAPAVWLSADGRTWRRVDASQQTGNEELLVSVARRDGVLVAAGLRSVERSTDGGVTWTATRFDGEAGVYRLSQDAAGFVLSDDAYGRIWTSPDGDRWTPAAWPAGQCTMAAFAASTWLSFCADSGATAWSADRGTTWQDTDPSGDWTAVVIGQGFAVAIDGTQRIWTSTDAHTWRPTNGRVPAAAVAYALVGRRLVVVGTTSYGAGADESWEVHGWYADIPA